MTARALAVGAPRLARLLIGLRWRTFRGMVRQGPRVAAARVTAVLALAVPLAYFGLFASALATLGEVGGRPAQEAALALAAAVITLVSSTSKIASGDLVLGRGGELALLLAQPVALPTLVLARALAGPATDLVGALFLLPVLAAGALAWAPAAPAPLIVVLLLMTSALVQMAVSALAQAVQVAVVHLVPPGWRRLPFVLAALLAAAGMAALWMSGSGVLRDPGAAAALLRDAGPAILAGPGGWITAPLRALAAGEITRALVATGALALGAGAAFALAALVARAAAARGWEQAAPLYAEASARPRGRGRPVRRLSLGRKDWRLLTRDRTRLVWFVALPLLFLGVQVFGSAGWAFTTGSPARMAVCAYSLAAYAATFGPLVHLEAERRAFWILRAVPVSLARLFAAKARFWALVLGGYVAVVYAALAALAGWAPSAALFSAGALAVLGAAIIAVLAVGLGSAHADLSEEDRPALGLATAYPFMIVAGLYNLVLVGQGGDERMRALALFAFVAVLAFAVGCASAREALDPEAMRARAVSPVLGALGLVLLFVGTRAVRAASGPAGAPPDAAALGWSCLVGAFGSWHWLRHGLRAQIPAWTATVVIAAGTAACLALYETAPRPWLLPAVTAALEELFGRGILQAGVLALLVSPGGMRPNRRQHLVAAAVGALAVLLAGSGVWNAAAVLAAVVPAAAFAASGGRLAAALAARVLVVLAMGAA